MIRKLRRSGRQLVRFANNYAHRRRNGLTPVSAGSIGFAPKSRGVSSVTVPIEPSGISGITVALSQTVMEWKAIITIYLAVGAPFAAARWLRTGSVETVWRRMASAVITMVAWPYAGLRSVGWLRTPERRSAPRANDLGN